MFGTMWQRWPQTTHCSIRKRAAFQAVAAPSGNDTSMLRELFRERVLDPREHRLRELIERHGFTLGLRGALIVSVAPAMVMYDCTLDRSMLTAKQVESPVARILLPLLGHTG